MEALVVVAHLCPGSESQLSAASSSHLTPPTQPVLAPAPSSQAEMFGVSADPNTWQSMPFCLSVSSVSPSRLQTRRWRPSRFRREMAQPQTDREWGERLDILVLP